MTVTPDTSECHDDSTTMEAKPLWHSLVSGSAGGAAAVLVGHPFDTIKTRLQTGRRDRIFRFLYRGVSARLAVTPVFWSCYYAGSQLGKAVLPADLDWRLRGLGAGMVSGVVSMPACAVADAVKIVAQNERLSAAAAARKLRLHTAAGWRDLARGLPPTLLFMVPASGVFYLTYDVFNEHVLPPDAPWRPLVAGGLAGIGEWTVGLPMDRVKTLVQSGESRGVGAAVRSIVRSGGVLSFYRGFVPSVFLRAFPANAAAFVAITTVDEKIFGHKTAVVS